MPARTLVPSDGVLSQGDRNLLGVSPASRQAKAELWEERKKQLVVRTLQLPDGRALSYHIDGDLVPGKPVILLLHGMMSSRVLFVTEDRPARCAFVVPNRPGYADSSDPGPDYTFERFARDMEALMDHLGVARFSVIGHSSGGPNALAVAAFLGVARVSVVACLCGDTDYRHPSAHTPVDPMAKDVLCCLARPLRRCWPLCCVPFILRCRLSVCACALIQRIALGRTSVFMRGMLKYEEVRLWEEAGGDNFFRMALTESLQNAVRPTPARRGMGGMLNDFALERMQRFGFDASSIESQVIFWSAEHDDPCLQPTIFNHSVLFPASRIHIVPGTGHMGVLAKGTFWPLVDAVLAAAAGTERASEP